MQIIGIVAEFDPFHQGHAHLIDQVRCAYPDGLVVCAMSGAFTQRGGAAIASKYARAEMALHCGVDLILELPIQWAAASAERFARGGVSLLSAAGATVLAFGSETGTLPPLQRAAEVLDSAPFSQALRPYLKQGLSFAAARQNALETQLGAAADVLRSPNNLLGIEYLRAIHSVAPELRAVTFPRVGSGHNREGETDGIWSASGLRQLLLSGKLEEACSGMPLPAQHILRREWDRKHCPAALEYNTRGIFTRLRTLSASAFAALPDCGEGLEHRLVRAVQESVTLTQCYDRIKSKRYAHARVRRLLLWAYLGLTAADCPAVPPYLRVLGLTQAGREILRCAKKRGCLPILTKPAAVKGMDAACRRQFELDARAETLWNLCLPTLLPAPNPWLVTPIVCG